MRFLPDALRGQAQGPAARMGPVLLAPVRQHGPTCEAPYSGTTPTRLGSFPPSYFPIAKARGAWYNKTVSGQDVGLYVLRPSCGRLTVPGYQGGLFMARIYKRGRVWYGDLYLRVHKKDGKGLVVRGKDGQPETELTRKRVPLGPHRRDAEIKLADMVKDRDAEQYGYGNRDISWADFCTKYLEWSKVNRARATHITNSRALKSVADAYPLVRLAQLTPEVLDGLLTKWRADKRGDAVCGRDLRALKTAARKAESWGCLPPRRWNSVKGPKEVKGRLLWWNGKELKALREVCRGPWETVLMLGALAGLRRGEIYWLAWDDVDFERRKVHVRAKDGWQPKDFEDRSIPMSQALRVYLEALRKRTPQDFPWVLWEKSGHGRNGLDRPTLGSMTIMFKRLVKKAGLKGSVHILRHSFGSNLASAGVPIYTISKMMGHSSVKTTEVYAKLGPDVAEAAVEQLPNLQPVGTKTESLSSRKTRRFES